jgi:uncharacterized phage infection (PIP) family protein YhgE
MAWAACRRKRKTRTRRKYRFENLDRLGVGSASFGGRSRSNRCVGYIFLVKLVCPQVSATLRDIQAAQQQTTSGTKAINDSNAAEDQLAHDNASVVEQLKALTQMARDNASAAEKLEENREHTASVFAKGSKESLRPQTPFAQPSPKPAIPKRRQIVMRNWF